MSAHHLVAGIVAAAALMAATASGDTYTPTLGDTAPSWSPDAEWIAFATDRDGGGVKVVAATGGTEAWIVRGQVSAYSIAPDWSRIAYQRGDELVVAQLDGTARRVVAATNGSEVPDWAPDSQRLAFAGSDGGLYVADVDGANAPRRVAQGFDPDWAPDGTRIAYVAGSRHDTAGIHVVDADGTSDVRLAPEAGDPRSVWDPTWAPDGTRIAYITWWKWVYLGVVDLTSGRIGGGYLLHGAGPFAWTPDGRGIVHTRSDTVGLAELDLATGREQLLLSPMREERLMDDTAPAFAPDGVRVAFSGGRECRDRLGIFVLPGDGSGRTVRVSNDCRVMGTPGDDTLRGTDLADVVLGLSGDDRLVASDPEDAGDSLRGGPGDDVLIGGGMSDVLEGGQGRDRLYGGPSRDTLVGGLGVDHLVGQGGDDVVDARDRARDVISCGTNASGTPERDEVFADRLDRVAEDCEIVHWKRTL